MSSRQEEKAARRAEREAAETKLTEAQARKKRLGLVAGAVLAVAAVAAVVIAVIAVTGGGSSDQGGSSGKSSGPSVPIPEQKIGDLAAAAKAAGCTVKNFPVQGSTHVTSKVTYKTNPPTSGNHNSVPAADGIYSPGQEPEKEHFVHTLEHGRVEVQYKPGTPTRTIKQLETLVNEKDGYHVLLFQNPTNMPFAVAATAWSHLLGCRAMNDKAFDAVRAFRTRYTDKAPEFVQ